MDDVRKAIYKIRKEIQRQICKNLPVSEFSHGHYALYVYAV